MTHYQYSSKAQEDKAKLISVLAYLTVIGWLISFYLYGDNKSPHARFHLRQSLGLIITAAVLSFIPLIGWGLNCILFLLWLMCIYQAYLGHIFHIPLLGDYYQEHLDFVI